MQKLHVYGQPRLPIIGTILIVGALSSVGSTNFQRSRAPGSSSGWLAAERCTPNGRCGAQSASMSRHDALVGKAENVVEVLAGVLGIAAGVGSAEYGDGAAATEEIAQGISELGRLAEGADEEHVEIDGKLREQIFGTRVADQVTSWPACSHHTPITWGMILARLAFMSRPYREGLGLFVTRSRTPMRSRRIHGSPEGDTPLQAWPVGVYTS